MTTIDLYEGYTPQNIEGTSVSYLTYGLESDREKTACLCVPEVGISSRRCFNTLFVASPPQSLLIRNYYMILVDDTDENTIKAIVRHRNLKEVVGLGVGNGAYLLAKLASSIPLVGLILISPPCKKPSWYEYLTGSLAALRLSRSGWSRAVKDHFSGRLFSPSTRQYLGGDSDLLKSYRRDVEEMDASKVLTQLKAVLSREDIREGVRKRITCRTLLIMGSQSIYYGESMELAREMEKSRLTVFEVEKCGTWVNEERVVQMLGVLDAFLLGLRQEGYGL